MVLTNSLKISGVTKADFLQLNLSRIRGKRGKSGAVLTRWLPNGLLKQDLLEA